MQLTFVNDLGEPTVVDIDAGMELENVMALLEAETGIAVAEQSIHYEGRDLNDPKRTIESYGVQNNSMLSLRRKVTVAGQTVEHDAETMRLQLLGDPHMMRRLEESQPEIANAARNNPARFAELIRQMNEQRAASEQERQQQMALLTADPYDVEAQQKIEEAIRQEQVLQNLQHAMEYTPEAFGRVHMLYIDVTVNGQPVKAFVDSGAQQTILSPDCAEACGIMRLLDKRFSGIARGVGTAKILGRIHSAPLKIGNKHLSCAFTVMEGRDVDLLFGLDMLKAYQACIDLERNVLRINGEEVRFLAEHELPDKAREFGQPPEEHPEPPRAPVPGATSSFPGSGSALGAAPRTLAAPPSQASQWSEETIKQLTDLGIDRATAINALNAANGNPDVAASMFF